MQRRNSLEDVVIKPVSTEKGVDLEKEGKYVFLVRKEANKVMVQKALEKIYKAKVVKVNIIPTHTKKIWRGKGRGEKGLNAKKAIITLKKGEVLKKTAKKKVKKSK